MPDFFQRLSWHVVHDILKPIFVAMFNLIDFWNGKCGVCPDVFQVVDFPWMKKFSPLKHLVLIETGNDAGFFIDNHIAVSVWMMESTNRMSDI